MLWKQFKQGRRLLDRLFMFCVFSLAFGRSETVANFRLAVSVSFP
jgi:hypothetical protein